ncbi:uncharacterized protein LOC106073105 isoform X2 [Biomphalaria glabrata]|uniref:Uncharacterized protein LOC106073105 isoform X2 n=1 Tax=Biomphalaria glabrata TaxID=6526 RepID=A0A9W2YDT5_BIOGL|nr:uncharacterized protein LOC106073105 isoform X2 [Biomphalaria glabrata]
MCFKKLQELLKLTVFLTSLQRASTYDPVLNVNLLGSQHCLLGYLAGHDQIVINITVDWTTGQETDWKTDLIVRTGDSQFCAVSMLKESCENSAKKDEQCSCNQFKGRVYYMTVNFTARQSHAGKKFEFIINRKDNQKSVKNFVLVPDIFGEVELRVRVDGMNIDILSPLCMYRFRADSPHKLSVCTENLNNPTVMVKVIESSKEQRKFTTACDTSDLDLVLGSNNFELTYRDDCNRTVLRKCLFEVYEPDVTTIRNTSCVNCDENNEASDWYNVLKWLLPVVIVFVAVTTMMAVMCRAKQEKQRRELIRSMSSHRSLAANKSKLSAARSKSGVNMARNRSEINAASSTSRSKENVQELANKKSDSSRSKSAPSSKTASMYS